MRAGLELQVEHATQPIHTRRLHLFGERCAVWRRHGRVGERGLGVAVGVVQLHVATQGRADLEAMVDRGHAVAGDLAGVVRDQFGQLTAGVGAAGFVRILRRGHIPRPRIIGIEDVGLPAQLADHVEGDVVVAPDLGLAVRQEHGEVTPGDILLQLQVAAQEVLGALALVLVGGHALQVDQHFRAMLAELTALPGYGCDQRVVAAHALLHAQAGRILQLAQAVLQAAAIDAAGEHADRCTAGADRDRADAIGHAHVHHAGAGKREEAVVVQRHALEGDAHFIHAEAAHEQAGRRDIQAQPVGGGVAGARHLLEHGQAVVAGDHGVEVFGLDDVAVGADHLGRCHGRAARCGDDLQGVERGGRVVRGIVRFCGVRRCGDGRDDGQGEARRGWGVHGQIQSAGREGRRRTPSALQHRCRRPGWRCDCVEGATAQCAPVSRRGRSSAAGFGGVISTCEILASHCRIRHCAVVQRRWRWGCIGYTQVYIEVRLESSRGVLPLIDLSHNGSMQLGGIKLIRMAIYLFVAIHVGSTEDAGQAR